MNWKLIVKDKTKQPKGNDYTKWKEQIAKECFYQCVYCSIHETPWGGIDHYHIEHYRPQSVEEFKKYALDICNLFYTCPVCNRFKSDDWPTEPDQALSIPCYPDPSKVDYATIFSLDHSTHKINGNNVAANYVIERLFLNRPQLIYERKENSLHQKETMLRKSIVELIKDSDDVEIKSRFIEIIDKIMDLIKQRQKIRPYKLAEIRR